MTSRRRSSQLVAPADPADSPDPGPLDGVAPDGLGPDAFGAEPEAVVRRAPFSDNPQVGARGQRTQQAILDAALAVFGEVGYQSCSIDRITTRAGCSRVSFYQYFSGKEDVFRYLSGQVARQLTASTDALDPVTPDEAGWVSLRAWLTRHTEIYDRYQPMFRAFRAASASDEEVATGSARWSERIVARIRSSLAVTDLPARQLDPLIALLQECLSRTFDIAAITTSVQPEWGSRDRLVDAVADVLHRSFFGPVPGVNIRSVEGPPFLDVAFAPSMAELLADDGRYDADSPNQKALAALLASGREVFVRRGYHATRVDDLAEAAGVSHGAFYRYFQNKDDLARVLTLQAVRTMSETLAELPAPGEGRPPGDDRSTAGLRRWLKRYQEVRSGDAAMIRVWVDAALEDASLRQDSAAAFDWGRRRMARLLAPRGFADVDADGVVLVGLLTAFGSRERSGVETDAACRVIGAGLYGGR